MEIMFKRNMEYNFCKNAKILKTPEKCCITRTIFKPFHFVKSQLAFNLEGQFKHIMMGRSFDMNIIVDLYVPLDNLITKNNYFIQTKH